MSETESPSFWLSLFLSEPCKKYCTVIFRFNNISKSLLIMFPYGWYTVWVSGWKRTSRAAWDHIHHLTRSSRTSRDSIPFTGDSCGGWGFVCLFEFWFLGLFVYLPACSWGRVSLCNFRWPGHNNVDQALTCRFQPGFGFASASLMLGLKDYCDWPVYLLTLVSFLIFLPSSFFF